MSLLPRFANKLKPYTQGESHTLLACAEDKEGEAAGGVAAAGVAAAGVTAAAGVAAGVAAGDDSAQTVAVKNDFQQILKFHNMKFIYSNLNCLNRTQFLQPSSLITPPHKQLLWAAS